MKTTLDPLYEKNHLVNAFAFCAGDPVNFVDPDGRDIWALDQKGYISLILKAESTRLFAVDNEGYLSDYIDLPNDKALTELSISYLAESTPRHRVSYTDILDWKSAVILFEFCANHSRVEWAIHKGKNVSLGTIHDEDSAGSWRDYGLSKAPGKSVHSHPGIDRVFMADSMNEDFKSLKNYPLEKAKKYYIYFPVFKEYTELTKLCYICNVGRP